MPARSESENLYNDAVAKTPRRGTKAHPETLNQMTLIVKPDIGKALITTSNHRAL